jgi:transcriptional regulator with XRE-family HTH domain
MNDRTGIEFATVAERVGWNLRLARQRADLTQRQLARRAGFHQDRIATWEIGECCPLVGSVVRLAEALDIAPGELLRETKGQPQSSSGTDRI